MKNTCKYFGTSLFRGLAAAALFVLLLAACAQAEVIINEVMASNGTYKNGEAYDWL